MIINYLIKNMIILNQRFLGVLIIVVKYIHNKILWMRKSEIIYNKKESKENLLVCQFMYLLKTIIKVAQVIIRLNYFKLTQYY